MNLEVKNNKRKINFLFLLKDKDALSLCSTVGVSPHPSVMGIKILFGCDGVPYVHQLHFTRKED